MYMLDGKPIQVPYGRRNVNVTKLELEDTLAALLARIEVLEAIVLSDKPEPVAEVDQPEDREDEPVEVEGEPPKARRGRKPKEATE